MPSLSLRSLWNYKVWWIDIFDQFQGEEKQSKLFYLQLYESAKGAIEKKCRWVTEISAAGFGYGKPQKSSDGN